MWNEDGQEQARQLNRKGKIYKPMTEMTKQCI